jgi:hypothetical protein
MILPGILCRAVRDPSPLAVSDFHKGTAKVPPGSRPQYPCHPIVYPSFPPPGPNQDTESLTVTLWLLTLPDHP